jgi:hypothetical protein
LDATDTPTASEEWGPSQRIVWVPVLAWVIAFGVAHTQAPLYYSNQNQYFLHGLAAGGLGDLREDWLANTQDPTPVFSAAVAFTYRHLGPAWFYAYYFVLLGVYFVSLVLVCYTLPWRPRTDLGRFLFLTLLVAAHAAVVRPLSVALTGIDYPWYFQTGVAGQYLLGPGLQPSAFGVLLLTSLVAFLRGRPVLAVLLSAAAATVHATYLLPAAMLTVTYMIVLACDGRWRTAVLTGACSLLAVLPMVAYSVTAFGPTSPGTFAEAQRLLAEVRIPHHTLVRRWLDPIAMGQIVWVVFALVLVYRTRLFPLLALPAAMSVALTLVQVATGSDTLALLFPWRMSAVLVPVATAVILARLAAILGEIPNPKHQIPKQTAGLGFGAWDLGFPPPGARRLAAGVGAAILVAVTVGGVVVTACGLGYEMNEDELPVLEYVRTHKQPGDVYLLPVTIPKVGAGPRGSVSTSFTPAPRSKPGTNLIPVDLMRFRLSTGAPIYVDFKSMPYKDTDVLEWFRRMELCQRWYAAKEWDRTVREEVVAAGITHVLATADRELHGDGLEQVYADDVYRVYRVRQK